MAPSEAAWCQAQLEAKADSLRGDGPFTLPCVVVHNERAARCWKSSQVRRFRKLEEDYPVGNVGRRITWVKHRWSWRKLRFDKYLLGVDTYIAD